MSNSLEIQEDTILVILGASGDLAKKKLVTATPLISASTTKYQLVPRTLRPRNPHAHPKYIQPV